MTRYGYDAVGNLATVSYPNGVAHSYSYDPQNRLTNLAVDRVAGTPPVTTPLASYAYQLEPAGHRTGVTELSGRMVSYGYDSIYRLTAEAIAGDPNGVNGAVNYSYDAVGNRLQMTSSLTPVPAGLFNYDANDRLTSDVYDANGNTVSSGGIASVYDFENHLVQKGGITLVYDGDGNRVKKTVAGVTTIYVVDDLNPTGFPQVIQDRGGNNFTQREYVYGLDLIAERLAGTPATVRFYGYDGHGSVRQLYDTAGTVTDTYDYDAFGNLIHSTGATPNNYLYAGEQFDADLGFYYLRARYLNTSIGRFSSMDTDEGNDEVPLSLHKYLYANGDPVNGIDPSGNDSIAEFGAALAVSETINSLSTISPTTLRTVTHFPSMAVQKGKSGIFAFDSTRFDFPDCNQCYGALRKYNYQLADPRGVPFTEPAHVREIIEPLILDGTGSVSFAEADTVNGFFGDILHAASPQPIRRIFLKTQQTFRVTYNGQVYPLTTKINQFIAKRNGKWDIEAVVVVP